MDESEYSTKEVVFEKGILPENHPRPPLLTVDVDRSEGAINEKLEGRRKVFVGLVFARRRNALLKLLDRDLAVLQWKQARDIQKCPLPRCATPFSTLAKEVAPWPAKWSVGGQICS